RGRPCAAGASDLFVYDLDPAAFEPAIRRAQRRVGESRCTFRQPAGRRDRAHLLQLERAQEGRTAAEEPAGDRAGREAAQTGAHADRCLAAADKPGLRAPASRRRDLEADRPAGQRWPTGAGDDLSPPALLSELRSLRVM